MELSKKIAAGKCNCWEYMQCNREPGGEKVAEKGICPASTEERLDGTHGGTNAGRACWVVAGSLCRGEIQGTFAQKFEECRACGFYAFVKDQETPYFHLSPVLLSRLR